LLGYLLEIDVLLEPLENKIAKFPHDYPVVSGVNVRVACFRCPSPVNQTLSFCFLITPQDEALFLWLHIPSIGLKFAN